jgi:hypothetical protein
VFGVPIFMFDGEPFWGHDRLPSSNGGSRIPGWRFPTDARHRSVYSSTLDLRSATLLHVLDVALDRLALAREVVGDRVRQPSIRQKVHAVRRPCVEAT